MNNKIVFFDIDGTLLDHDKKLPLTTKNAINALKASGVRVAIATGRAPFMYKDLRDELRISSFVSFNGQYVIYEDEVIYKNPLNNNALHSLKEYSYRNDHPVVFMDESTMKATVKDHQHIHVSMGSLKFQHPEFDPGYYHEREIFQALLFCTKDEEELYVNQYNDFDFVRWHEVATDILPSGGSKAEGIKIMIDRLGIKKENVFAFGDGLNDIEMIRYVGTGIAMGNAKDEVKQIANFVTKDVDDDGILYGLEQLGLLK